MGTGPFKFVKYETDQYVEVAANPDYRGGKPRSTASINRYFKTTATAAAALKSGEIQVSYVESDDAKTFANNPAFKIVEADSYVVNYLGFNGDAPLWKDERVRKAVMYAIDRNAIIASLYGGAAKPANCAYVADNLVPAGIEPLRLQPGEGQGAAQGSRLGPDQRDKPITLLSYYTAPQAANVMAAMQAMLVAGRHQRRAEGASMSRPITAPSTRRSPTGRSIRSSMPASRSARTRAASTSRSTRSRSRPPAATWLACGMPDVSGALDAALAEVDDSKLAGRFQDVCKAMNKTVPWGTMWVSKRYGVVSTKLKDMVWLPAPAGGPYDQKAQNWSITP